MPYKKSNTSVPMKLVTVWLTEEEKTTLDELARERKITLSHALREGLKLYFDDARDWIEGARAGRQGAEAA
jgi:predicted transcriptional regulator